MEKEEWKYVLELRFEKESSLPHGYDMYFTSLDQAVKRITEIDLDDFIRISIYHPFWGNQIRSLAILEIETGAKLLETEVIDSSTPWVEPGEIEPGIYFKFPKGLEYFEKKSGIDFKNFNIKDDKILVSYLVLENHVKSKEVIAFEALYRQLHTDRTDILTVDYTTKFFGNGQKKTRDIATAECVEQYFFNSSEDALKKLLATDFSRLDESVAWESGSDIYYSSAKIKKRETTLASLKSERIGILQVGSYFPDVPGIYVKFEDESGTYSFDIPYNLYASPGIFMLAKYNEMRNDVVVCEELKAFLNQKNEQKPSKQAPRMKAAKKQLASKIKTRKI